MQTRIEPPFLMSRILTFILATAVVVLVVLVITLVKMFPVERPQIFFLEGVPAENTEVRLTEMPGNIETYKTEFIREYVKARNEISPDALAMQKKWNDRDGIVHTLSGDDVWATFSDTDMWSAIMTSITQHIALPAFTCRVNFPESYSVIPYAGSRTKDEYEVHFYYDCNLNGQTHSKDYRIHVKLQAEGDMTIKWVDRLDNPLGIKVIEYNHLDDNGDPLSKTTWN